MTRVTSANTTKRRHRKILSYAKGFYGRSKTNFRLANQLTRRAMVYRYIDVRNKKRNARAEWIQNINAFVREFGINYSTFISLFNKSRYVNILDRKSLSIIIRKNTDEARELVSKIINADKIRDN